MTEMFLQPARLDRMAIALSGLCVVHCVTTSVLLVLLSSFGHVLGAPWVHEVGLGLAMLLGAIALGRGVAEHGFMLPGAVGGMGLGIMAGAMTLGHNSAEALYTIAGVAILALGHDLNRRAVA